MVAEKNEYSKIYIYMNTYSEKKGFTLLELLIVIAIIAALSTILIIVINPSETLKQSRDSQRIADLSTLKTALGLYMTATSSPKLDSIAASNGCNTPTKVWYSAPSSTAVVTITNSSNGTSFATAGQPSSTVTAGLINGTGWIPVNLASLTGGSPISNMPLDPVNTVVAGANTSSSLVYRYACKLSPLSFEVDASLESTQYTSVDNKLASDGGDNANYFEVGTGLGILPSDGNF